MADIRQITVNGTTYDLKDEAVRQKLEDLLSMSLSTENQQIPAENYWVPTTTDKTAWDIIKTISNLRQEDLSTYTGTSGEIVQHIGTTANNLTNGYIYKNVSGTWTRIDVQPTPDVSGIATNAEAIQAINDKLGAANGIATLDSNTKVPSSQLPSYVDDVLEYPSLSDFPAEGTSGIIYIATNTNITYRWGGSTYVPIGSDLALGETSSTAYRGDRGKTAYDHSQIVTGNPHNTAIADISGLQAALNTIPQIILRVWSEA